MCLLLDKRVVKLSIIVLHLVSSKQCECKNAFGFIILHLYGLNRTARNTCRGHIERFAFLCVHTTFILSEYTINFSYSTIIYILPSTNFIYLLTLLAPENYKIKFCFQNGYFTVFQIISPIQITIAF